MLDWTNHNLPIIVQFHEDMDIWPEWAIVSWWVKPQADSAGYDLDLLQVVVLKPWGTDKSASENPASQGTCLEYTTYCGWKQSCTSWKRWVYPMIYRLSTIEGGAGFLPSTVCYTEFAESDSLSIRKPTTIREVDGKLMWSWCFPRDANHMTGGCDTFVPKMDI